MKYDSIAISANFSVDPKELYSAWLDSKKHSAFSGGKANISKKIGGKFTAWGGYILGKNIELKPYKKIVQTWRSTDFAEDDEDSMLEVLFINVGKGTQLILKHKKIPQGRGKELKQGWIDYYFEPMKEYFKGGKA